MLEFRTSWTFFRNVLNWCSFNQQTEISCEERKYLHPKRTIIPPTPMKYFHSVFVSVYKACILFLYLHLHWWARNWIWLVGFLFGISVFPFSEAIENICLVQQTLPSHLHSPCSLFMVRSQLSAAAATSI